MRIKIIQRFKCKIRLSDRYLNSKIRWRYGLHYVRHIPSWVLNRWPWPKSVCCLCRDDVNMEVLPYLDASTMSARKVFYRTRISVIPSISIRRGFPLWLFLFIEVICPSQNKCRHKLPCLTLIVQLIYFFLKKLKIIFGLKSCINYFSYLD